MPVNVVRIRNTLLRCIDTEVYEFGRHSDLDEARAFVLELERLWPGMPDLPDGKDMFAEHPVSGTPVPGE